MSTIAERLSAVDTKLNNILVNANTQLTNKGKTAVSDLSDLPSAVAELKNPTGTISITENGTVDVSQYASADVSVSGSGGKNVQANLGFYVTTQTGYKYTGLKMTVSKTGTYTIKWLCRRDGTSNTYGSALYKNGVQYGEANTTWAETYYLNGIAQSSTINTFQLTTLEHVQLTEGDELAIYTKSGSNGTWVYTHGLVIEEE